MERLKVNLAGIEIDNPVIPASGTFGFGYEFAELYDINVLGTFSFKGTTLSPRLTMTGSASVWLARRVQMSIFLLNL